MKQILDSGNRRVYENGFQRDMAEGKGDFSLLPWHAIWEVAKHCEEGAKKYGRYNIDKGCPQSSLIDSAFRHLCKYILGWDDEEHLRACAWNILWAIQQNTTHPEMQDLPNWIERDKRCNNCEYFDTNRNSLFYLKCTLDDTMPTAEGYCEDWREKDDNSQASTKLDISRKSEKCIQEE